MTKNFADEVNKYIDEFNELDGLEMPRIYCEDVPQELVDVFNSGLVNYHTESMELVQHPAFTLIRAKVVYGDAIRYSLFQLEKPTLLKEITPVAMLSFAESLNSQLGRTH